MKAIWLSDARKIPDEVMGYIRRIAVQAIEEKHYSPELIAEIFGISRTSIYDWLRWYRTDGEDALDTMLAPGAPQVITPHIDQWLKETILNSTPEAHGYDTVLWTLKILVNLLKAHFGISVSDSTIALHLHQLNLSCQQPAYQARQRDPQKVEDFVEVKFPMIQRVAEKIGADIAFEDEAGIGIMARSGRTWGEVNKPPIVTVNQQRGGFNVLSIITAKGELKFDIEETAINGEIYVKFLQQILDGRDRPMIVIADNASFHRSKEVRVFVRKNRRKIRMFFLPPYAPQLNPDEQVWNDIKHRQLEKQSIKNKSDLKSKIGGALKVLQVQTEKIRSFFQLPDTKYAAIQEP